MVDATMPIDGLLQKALSVGASEEEVDSALEQPNVHQDLVTLIMAKQAQILGLEEKVEDGPLESEKAKRQLKEIQLKEAQTHGLEDGTKNAAHLEKAKLQLKESQLFEGFKCKLQGLARKSLPDLKLVLHGLEILREIGVMEMPAVMDSIPIAYGIVHQASALEYQTVMQKDGLPDVVLREEPGQNGKIMVTRLENGITVEILSRENQGYTKVRFEGQGNVNEGWVKTENLRKIAGSEMLDTKLLRICSEDERDDKVTFFFVKADKIRLSKQNNLPHFQELFDWGWLEQHTFSPGDLYRGDKVNELLAISHRWEDAKNPDPDGTQFKRIRKFLNKNPAGQKAKLVWMDFWCAPQGKNRTPAEYTYFKRVLDKMDMVYLGATVLLLVDLSYSSRFWTEFEAWLSMQACSKDGLRPALKNKCRSHIEVLHNARTIEARGLREMWAEKTPSQAYDMLKSPDVPVTNQSDKTTKLPLILELDKEVTHHFTKECAEDLLKNQKRKVPELRWMGFSHETLIDILLNFIQSGTQLKELMELGFTAAQLKEGGLSAAELKKGEFSAAGLKERGFSVTGLNEGGFPAAELKQGGFAAAELRHGGFSAADLEERGFSAAELKEGGFSAGGLRQAGFSLAQLKFGGFSAAQLKEAGFPADCLKGVGFSAVELKEGGFSAADLKEVGFSVAELGHGGFSAAELRPAFSLPRLKFEGFSAAQFKEAEFPADCLKVVGFSAMELKEGGFSAADLKEAGFSIAGLLNVFSLAELSQAGYDVHCTI